MNSKEGLTTASVLLVGLKLICDSRGLLACEFVVRELRGIVAVFICVVDLLIVFSEGFCARLGDPRFRYPAFLS